MLPVIAIGLILVTHVFAYDFSWGPAPGAAVVGVPEWTRYFQAVNGKATPKKDVRSCRPGGHTDVWGASFDDGPGVETLSVIEYFKNINMLATFWVIGVNIPSLPDTLAATYQAGHEIGTHTWSHKDLTTLSDDQIVAELVYGSRAIYEVIGVFPKYFRPPYGAIDERVRKIGAMLGLRAVRWNFDSDDWQHKDKNMTIVPTLFRDWMEQEMDQGISLQHDYYADTAAAIPPSMAFLLQGGKTIVPLTKCIGDKEGAYHNPVLQEFFESGQFNRHFGNTQFIRHPKALIKQSSLQSYGQYIPQEIDPDSLFYITGFVVVAIAAGLLMLSRKMRKNQATVAVSASLTIVFILSSIVLWIS